MPKEWASIFLSHGYRGPTGTGVTATSHQDNICRQHARSKARGLRYIVGLRTDAGNMDYIYHMKSDDTKVRDRESLVYSYAANTIGTIKRKKFRKNETIFAKGRAVRQPARRSEGCRRS